MMVYRTERRLLAAKVREEVVLGEVGKPGWGHGRGFAGHVKDFGSYLRSNEMPLKGVNKGSDIERCK